MRLQPVDEAESGRHFTAIDGGSLLEDTGGYMAVFIHHTKATTLFTPSQQLSSDIDYLALLWTFQNFTVNDND